MSNVLVTLNNSVDALRVFERAIDVVQNNVANSVTPGYARQSIGFQAKTFDPDSGLIGGVEDGPPQSSRDSYAENAVRSKSDAWGRYSAMSTVLSRLEGAFDVTGQTGVPGALTQLYKSFSDWSVAPNDGPARQRVMDNAEGVARAFSQTYTQVASIGEDVGREISFTVDQINEAAGKIRDLNVEIKKNGPGDSGVDAQLHSALQGLSELVDISVLTQDDGSVIVLAGGQTAIVVGENQYDLGLSFEVVGSTYASAPASARLIGPDGEEITSAIQGGRLSGLLEVRNEILPSIIGDGSQPGDLNRLANAFATRVNELLTGGLVSQGPPEVPGVALFTVNAANNAAKTLAVNPAVSADTLAAIQVSPLASNGVALDLAGLANSTDPLDQLDGLTYTEFYGNLTARVGDSSQEAGERETLQKQLLTQSTSLRQEISGVSLDQEAIQLLQYQRAYQAAARMVTILNNITETLLNLGR